MSTCTHPARLLDAAGRRILAQLATSSFDPINLKSKMRLCLLLPCSANAPRELEYGIERETDAKRATSLRVHRRCALRKQIKQPQPPHLARYHLNLRAPTSRPPSPFCNSCQHGCDTLGVPTAAQKADGTPLNLTAIIKDILESGDHIVVSTSMGGQEDIRN